MSAFAFIAASVVQVGQTFTCAPVAVWDGDGPVWCAEGLRLRLAGIAAREMDNSCKPGQPCPAAAADLARNALVLLVGRPIGSGAHGHVLIEGPPLRCRSNGPAGGRGTGAWCLSPSSADTSCAMVRGGWAARRERFWQGHRCP